MKILITSPYYRCGSTLVQRCIHQCEDTCILGEANNFFTSLSMLNEEVISKSKFPAKIMMEKLENWANKVDDDYSLCHNTQNIKNGIEELCKSFFDYPFKNIGIKTIGESARSLHLAQCLDFKILYVRRPWRDSMASYIKQDWSLLDNYYSAYSRSLTINNDKYFEYISKNSLYFRVLEYENIHTEIFSIMDEMGLKYDKDKIDQVLNNKVNPGYK